MSLLYSHSCTVRSSLEEQHPWTLNGSRESLFLSYHDFDPVVRCLSRLKIFRLGDLGFTSVYGCPRCPSVVYLRPAGSVLVLDFTYYNNPRLLAPHVLRCSSLPTGISLVAHGQTLFIISLLRNQGSGLASLRLSHWSFPDFSAGFVASNQNSS